MIRKTHTIRCALNRNFLAAHTLIDDRSPMVRGRDIFLELLIFSKRGWDEGPLGGGQFELYFLSHQTREIALLDVSEPLEKIFFGKIGYYFLIEH